MNDRHKYVGSSDVAALFNMGRAECPTVIDLWWRKVEPEAFPDKTGVLLDAGNEFEPTILENALRNIEAQVVQYQYQGVVGRLRATTDMVCYCHEGRPPLPVEGKFITSPDEIALFGESGTSQVPRKYALQCHAHIAAHEAQMCWLHAWLGFRGFQTFIIRRDESVSKMIIDRANWFMDLVDRREMPEGDHVPVIETLKRISRDVEGEATIPKEVIDEYEEAKAEFKSVESRKKLAHEVLINELGERSRGTDGHRVVTYLKNKKGYRSLRVTGG